MKIASVILAAGQGTRMNSSTPKVLHPLLGKPMALFSIETATQVAGNKPYLVVGYGADRIREDLGDAVEYILQEPQLGTGHALLQAEPTLRGVADLILVMLADMPLITPSTLGAVLQAQSSQSGPLTMLTQISEVARGFGRVLRNSEGAVQAVVEEAQATPEQLQIRELNTSVYCFAADWLWGALARLPLSPKGEYYLTDVVAIAVSDGLPVQAVTLADPTEAIGINDRIHLAEAVALLRKRTNERWMSAGVTLVDPARTYIEATAAIGQDTVIWPDTYLRGATTIGSECVVGPNAVLKDTHLGDRCRVVASILEGAVVEEEVDIGPYAHLRKGAHLGRGVHMGNFGEVKNSTLGPGTKMGHFSYIGDATIGPNVNIGAGTITCNFDGEKKNRTDIGAEAFIGSDTMLVAPVKVGEGARTGAGSVVTKDVPPDTLAVGMPARPIRKLVKRD